MNKIHFVYKTVNQLTGHYYIGIHSTNCIEDKYLGSGKLLQSEIKKHGRENFKREILCYCDSRKEAFEKERELVSIQTLQDELNYNLIIGGNCGYVTTASKRSLFSKSTSNTGQSKTVYFTPTHDPYDLDWYYLIQPKIEYTEWTDGLGRDIPLNMGDFYTKSFELFSSLYNNKKTHNQATKHVEKLSKLPAYYKNIIIYKVQVYPEFWFSPEKERYNIAKDAAKRGSA